MDIAHTGMVLLTGETPRFLHAPLSGGKVTLSSGDLAAYVQGIRSHTGVVIGTAARTGGIVHTVSSHHKEQHMKRLMMVVLVAVIVATGYGQGMYWESTRHRIRRNPERKSDEDVLSSEEDEDHIGG